MMEDNALVDLVRSAYQFKTLEEHSVANWDFLQRLSDRHRVTPALAALRADFFPPSVHAWIDTSLVRAGRQMLAVRRVLNQFADVFHKQGIRALILKGLALQDWVYGRHCRGAGDIDLFVPRGDVVKVLGALRAIGFSPFPHEGALTFRNIIGVEIDLHTSMLESYVGTGLRFDEAWDRRMDLKTLPFPTLSASDHLVFVLMHGWKHQWCRLSWIVDSALIAQRLTTHEWDAVQLQAQKQRASTIVGVGLEMCREVLEPPGIEWGRVLRHDCQVVVPLAQEYRRRLFLPMKNSLQAKLANISLHMRALEGIGHRSRYIAGRFLNAYIP
jgi:hypothetical protein